MGNTLTLRELTFRGMNVSQEFELFDKPLVLANIDDDSSTATALSEHQGALRLLHLPDQRRSVGSEFADGLDVVLKVRSLHGYSLAYVGAYVQMRPTQVLPNGFAVLLRITMPIRAVSCKENGADRYARRECSNCLLGRDSQ